MLIIKPAKTLTLFIKFWSKTTPKRGCFSASPSNTYLAEETGDFVVQQKH